MARTRIPLRFLIAAAAALALAGPAPAKKPAPESVPGELLVGFRADISASTQKQLLKEAGAVEKKRFAKIHGSLARVESGTLGTALDRLRRDSRVRYAEPNFLLHSAAVPNDPFYGQLWAMPAIDAPRAWDVTTGGAVTVAVIDTGVEWSHPDLADQIWANPGENCSGCRTDGVDNDRNGYVDDWHGWDFVSDDNNPADDHGHGTHVAGTVGAVGNNGVGVAGVSWRVRLMPLKFLNAQGSGNTADAISAVLYSAENGAAVSNNSWAGDEFSQALADAITVAGQRNSLFVAAAGNDGSDNDQLPTYPASYDLPNVVTVAATDRFDGVAYFSNVGRRSVDLGAPGVDIYSTWRGGSYQSASGTSMATPHVSGAAALAKAAFPSATALGLKALILDSVQPTAALRDVTSTGGRLNAGNALACANAPKLAVDSPGASFAVDVGSAISISAVAANCANAAGVSVSATINGSPLALSARGDGLYTAAYTPTARGSLTIAITASAGGASTTRTVTGTARQAYAITPGGPSVTITTSAPDENALLKFTGRAGQRVSLALSSVTIPAALVSIKSPAGATLASSYASASGGFIDAQTLTAQGVYAIEVDPLGTGAGSMTLTLYDVPPDATGAISLGGAEMTVATTTPGQNARVTFAGAAGHAISLKLSAVTASLAFVSILKPDGSTLVPPAYVGAAGGFVDKQALPVAGTYTILFDPQNATTGGATLTLYDVPPDAGGPIAANGAATALATSTPGQNGKFTFNGTAGQRISLNISNVTFSSAFVALVRPDGTTLGNNAFVGAAGAFVDTQSLPATGTYAIVVDPQGPATGAATFNLYTVPPDAGGTLAPNGPSLTTTITTPGQNARVTFDGQPGQRISLRVGPSTLAAANLTILKPDGTVFVASTFFGSAGTVIDARTLPASGTYSILIDPQGTATGSATLTLYEIPADPGGTLIPGGSPVTVSITAPGQKARLTFAGRAGQRISLSVGSATLSAFLSITRPDGSSLAGPTFFGTGGTFVDTRALAADGTYTVTIEPLGTAIGSATLTLYDVPPDAGGYLASGGAPLTISMLTPGQNARSTFAGTAGQTINLRFSSVTVWLSFFSILKPDGTALVPQTYMTSMGQSVTATLPATGTYMILVDPYEAATGSMTLTLM